MNSYTLEDVFRRLDEIESRLSRLERPSFGTVTRLPGTRKRRNPVEIQPSRPTSGGSCHILPEGWKNPKSVVFDDLPDDLKMNMDDLRSFTGSDNLRAKTFERSRNTPTPFTPEIEFLPNTLPSFPSEK